MSTDRKKIEDGYKRPQDRYNAANIQRVNLNLNHKTDADIIEWINKQPSKQGAIKDAIRHYLEASK